MGMLPRVTILTNDDQSLSIPFKTISKMTISSLHQYIGKELKLIPTQLSLLVPSKPHLRLSRLDPTVTVQSTQLAPQDTILCLEKKQKPLPVALGNNVLFSWNTIYQLISQRNAFHDPHGSNMDVSHYDSGSNPSSNQGSDANDFFDDLQPIDPSSSTSTSILSPRNPLLDSPRKSSRTRRPLYELTSPSKKRKRKMKSIPKPSMYPSKPSSKSILNFTKHLKPPPVKDNQIVSIRLHPLSSDEPFQIYFQDHSLMDANVSSDDIIGNLSDDNFAEDDFADPEGQDGEIWPPLIDHMIFTQLVHLGFSLQDVQSALTHHPSSFNDALSWLNTHASNPNNNQVSQEHLQTLISLGINPDIARNVLLTTNNIELAANLALQMQNE